MKKVINYIICILVATGVAQAAYAQSPSSNKNKSNLKEVLNDSSCKQLQKDLNIRNPQTKNHNIYWKDSGHGYNGRYSLGHVQYMACYNRNGNYIGTLTKKDWNAYAPVELKSLYNKSPYKYYRIIGYWEVSEVTEPKRKEYYLELNDEQNNATSVWVNEDGNFSTTPSGSRKTREMYLVYG